MSEQKKNKKNINDLIELIISTAAEVKDGEKSPEVGKTVADLGRSASDLYKVQLEAYKMVKGTDHEGSAPDFLLGDSDKNEQKQLGNGTPE